MLKAAGLLPTPPTEPKFYRHAGSGEWIPDIKGYVTYAIMCENGMLYKGFTEHFKDRMTSHFNGTGCYTTARMVPSYIYHYEVFKDKHECTQREVFYKTIEGLAWLRGLKNPKTIKP